MSTQTLALLFNGFISTELGDTLMSSGNWSRESGPITSPSRSHCWTASQNFSPYVKTLFQFSPCAGNLADPLAPILKPSLRPVQILSNSVKAATDKACCLLATFSMTSGEKP